MLPGFVPVLFALVQAPSPTPAPAEPSPAARPAPSGPVVVLETTMGRILVGLDRAKAPITVANFLKYVRSGHYDGTIFHRVIPSFMVQGGGYDESMQERPTGAPIRNEARNGLRNLRGTIAMARTTDPNSATAQFFVNLKDNPFLDFGVKGAGYAVFGEVLEGMDVVDKIAAVPTTTRGDHGDVPRTPIVIKSAREEKAARKPAAPASSAAPKPTPSPGP